MIHWQRVTCAAGSSCTLSALLGRVAGRGRQQQLLAVAPAGAAPALGHVLIPAPVQHAGARRSWLRRDTFQPGIHLQQSLPSHKAIALTTSSPAAAGSTEALPAHQVGWCAFVAGTAAEALLRPAEARPASAAGSAQRAGRSQGRLAGVRLRLARQAGRAQAQALQLPHQAQRCCWPAGRAAGRVPHPLPCGPLPCAPLGLCTAPRCKAPGFRVPGVG